jgi:2-dehydro-3-deoxyphosphooctonate aldolase (KDO 8-P synthase)
LEQAAFNARIKHCEHRRPWLGAWARDRDGDGYRLWIYLALAFDPCRGSGRQLRKVESHDRRLTLGTLGTHRGFAFLAFRVKTFTMPKPNTSLWKSLRSRRQMFLIAGPCVIESESLCLRVAETLLRKCRESGVTYIFKASYDKSNRTSGQSFRGPGIEAGLKVLAKVRAVTGVPVLTDIHSESQVGAAAEVVDILQIPALLCRQTDLIVAAVRTNKIVNIKKGQFLSPVEMGQVVKKAAEAGGDKILVTERGAVFGYNNLVADMRSIPVLRSFGCPVIFDATHSVQLPGAGGTQSGGQREFAPVLARCAVVAGADGLFIETHPEPDAALSDGPNMIPLKDMPGLITTLAKLHAVVR